MTELSRITEVDRPLTEHERTLNELAILEDQANVAQGQAAERADRIIVLDDEIASLRFRVEYLESVLDGIANQCEHARVKSIAVQAGAPGAV